MNVPNGSVFFEAAGKLVGKTQLEISQALIDFYFDGREFGYQEAKSLYKEEYFSERKCLHDQAVSHV